MIVKTANDMSYVRHNFTPVKNKLLNKLSNAEDHFEFMLKQTDMFYVREKGNFQYDTRWCYYDFYIPFYRLYIEIDGSSHNSIEQKKIDKEKHEIIDWKKRFLVRLTNEEVLGLKEISLDYLINRLCEQRNNYESHFFGFSLNEYLQNLVKNINKGIQDMLEDSGIDVSKDRNVFMYSKYTGRIYRFQNECIAKLNFCYGLRAIRNFIVNTDYSRRSSKRVYVMAYSEEECISRIKSCIGIDLEYNGNIPLSCTLESLIPMMSEEEKIRWLYNKKVDDNETSIDKILLSIKQFFCKKKVEYKENYSSRFGLTINLMVRKYMLAIFVSNGDLEFERRIENTTGVDKMLSDFYRIFFIRPGESCGEVMMRLKMIYIASAKERNRRMEEKRKMQNSKKYKK